MHVISQDFSSPCLKTKKHWNSFTTKFFVPPSILIHQLQKSGTVEFDHKVYEELENQKITSPWNGEQFANMPKLKEYLEVVNAKKMK
jgi:aprataxin